MSYIQISDASGKTLNISEVNGRRYPAFPLELLQNVPHTKLRDDDILLCSFPKSGSHWSFEICRLLMKGTTDVEVLSKSKLMVELNSEKQLDKHPSPRIINTHFRFDCLPSDVTKKKLKIVYIRRNPKDVAVSFYNHIKKSYFMYKYDGEFKDYLTLSVEGALDYGSWFDYVLDWEKVIATNTELSILDLTYEDLKEDPIKEIRKISDFLELERNEELFSKIKHFCSFDTMQERYQGIYRRLEHGHRIIYRKGEVGDWKNWFTVEQNDWFDEIYKRRMAESKLQVKFTLNQNKLAAKM